LLASLAVAKLTPTGGKITYVPMRTDALDVHAGNSNDAVKRYTGANGETIFCVKASDTAVIDLCNSPVSY